MTTVTEGDLKRLEDLINNRFSELDRKIDSIDKKLDVYIAKTDEQLRGIEKRLDDTNKRIDDTNTRLNTITFGIFSVVGVFATGILGIMAKIVFFPNP